MEVLLIFISSCYDSVVIFVRYKYFCSYSMARVKTMYWAELAVTQIFRHVGENMHSHWLGT